MESCSALPRLSIHIGAATDAENGMPVQVQRPRPVTARFKDPTPKSSLASQGCAIRVSLNSRRFRLLSVNIDARLGSNI